MTMVPESIGLIGHLGPLANAVAEKLKARGLPVARATPGDSLGSVFSAAPGRLILFPFPPDSSRRAWASTESFLSSLRTTLDWAVQTGVRRIVLRSHAIAYGSSMKNPGLLDEGRTTLLPKDSVERRWLAAEGALFRICGSGEGARASCAAVRLTSVLDSGEGDLVAAMLARRATVPMAGYDPQLQLLSLRDAAECLVAALLSEAQGVFNGAPAGTVPVRSALRAANSVRFGISGALQKPLRQLFWKAGLARFPGETMDRVKYNWTVSPERAAEAFAFRARDTSSHALRDYLTSLGHGRPDRVLDEYDEFGLDVPYLERFSWWFDFLAKVYWRVEHEGIDNVPSEDPALLVSNHRGFMPFDGVVHRHLILRNRGRHIRFLVIPSLFKFPFLSNFLIKQGGVVASQTNARKLFQRRELVGIFPEGINGAFRMYKGAYKLGELGRNAFARMAIENQVPLIPAPTIGHVEIFPILGRVESPLVVRHTGWPFLPITPTFPFLPAPLPTKWHIRYLEPIPVSKYAPEDSSSPLAVGELASRLRDVLQASIDDMLRRRRHIFSGKIFGEPPAAAPGGRGAS